MFVHMLVCVCVRLSQLYLNVSKPCMCSHEERDTKLTKYKLAKLCITGTHFPYTLLSGLQMIVYKAGNIHKCFLEMNEVGQLPCFLSSDLMAFDVLNRVS